jgi:proteic killer suppression protein
VVVIERFAEKRLQKVPAHIREKLLIWMNAVEEWGLEIVRRTVSYHDEPLKGARSGQRSIRLNRAYRAIYIERPNGELVIVSIIEVNKHDY